MSMNDVENAWRSPRNQPTPEEIEREQGRCLAKLRNRQRGFYLGMTLIFIWLTIITGTLIRHWLWPAAARNAIWLHREWAIVPLLALPWMAAIGFVIQYRRRSQPPSSSSIGDSLRALAAQARLSAGRKRTILWMHLISTPLLALSVMQIYAAGKARPNEVASMVLVFVVLAGVSVAALAYDLRRDRRELNRLESLVQEYEV